METLQATLANVLAKGDLNSGSVLDKIYCLLNLFPKHFLAFKTISEKFPSIFFLEILLLV